MKYYQIKNDPTNGTILYQQNHDLLLLKQGERFEEELNEPFIAELDEEHLDGQMHTFYESPAIIATKAFYQDLLDCGVSNIDAYPVIITNPVTGAHHTNYTLLNIIGKISCAVMSESEHDHLGEGMSIIDDLVIDSSKVSVPQDLFLVAEDTDCIVISERVYLHLSSRGYKDVVFKEVKQV